MLPNTTRPQLPHAVTMEAPRGPRVDRPPFRRSRRFDERDSVAEERRRAYSQGPRAPSFDEDDVNVEHEECGCRHSIENSGQTADTRNKDEQEPESTTSPPSDELPVDRNTHIRGVLADRVDRRDSPLALRAPSRTHSQGVFERRLPKIYKPGLMDKTKRASSSALYDRSERSPTEAFYNATGSTRLSSQELYEKFCSEDFTSLYGLEVHRRHNRKPPHSKSTGSSGSDMRHERGCCKRTPCGSQPALHRRRPFHAPHSDRSTDSEETSPRRSALLLLESDTRHSTDCSRSAPLLSPDRIGSQFPFDISERSEVTSNRDDTPSDATETGNLSLYEEPRSDRTSICELYDAACTSNRTSFRRETSKRLCRPFDFSELNFRAIDDESPRPSRRTSHRSVDETLRQNSDSHSWASDSIFTTPERRYVDTSPTSTDTRRYHTAQADSIRADSVTADSTLAETTTADELPSVVEKLNKPLTLDLDIIELDKERPASTPVQEIRLASRPSMHKLEPFEPERLSGGGNRNGVQLDDDGVKRRRGASEPRRSARCFPL